MRVSPLSLAGQNRRQPAKPAAPTGPTPWTSQDGAIWGQVSKDPAQLNAWQQYRQKYPNRSLVGWEQRGKPGYKAPAPAAPTPGQGGGGAAGQSGAYLDPIAINAIQRLNFDSGNQTGDQFDEYGNVTVSNPHGGQIGRDEALEQGDYTAGIESLLRQRNQQVRGDRQNANRRGALYSTSLDNQISEGETEYQSQKHGMERHHTYNQDSWEAARRAIIEGQPLGVAAERAQAAGRASTGAVNEAATGEPDAAGPAGAKAPKPGQISAAQKEWWRKRNKIAVAHGEKSQEVKNFQSRNPMPS